MMHVKMLAAAAAFVGGLGLASAGAAPLAPVATDTITGGAVLSTVAYGCGPGGHPGPTAAAVRCTAGRASTARAASSVRRPSARGASAAIESAPRRDPTSRRDPSNRASPGGLMQAGSAPSPFGRAGAAAAAVKARSRHGDSRGLAQAAPHRSGTLMARDCSGGASPSPEERAAAVRAGRKRLGADGCPRPASTPGADSADRRAGARPAADERGTDSIEPRDG